MVTSSLISLVNSSSQVRQFWSPYLHDERGGDYGADTKLHQCAWTERIKKKKNHLNKILRDSAFTKYYMSTRTHSAYYNTVEIFTFHWWSKGRHIFCIIINKGQKFRPCKQVVKNFSWWIFWPYGTSIDTRSLWWKFDGMCWFVSLQPDM